MKFVKHLNPHSRTVQLGLSKFRIDCDKCLPCIIVEWTVTEIFAQSPHTLRSIQCWPLVGLWYPFVWLQHIKQRENCESHAHSHQCGRATSDDDPTKHEMTSWSKQLAWTKWNVRMLCVVVSPSLSVTWILYYRFQPGASTTNCTQMMCADVLIGYSCWCDVVNSIWWNKMDVEEGRCCFKTLKWWSLVIMMRHRQPTSREHYGTWHHHHQIKCITARGIMHCQLVHPTFCPAQHNDRSQKSLPTEKN